jgi:hypothetical protein
MRGWRRVLRPTGNGGREWIKPRLRWCRRWSRAEKEQIVAAAMGAGRGRFRDGAGHQLFRWRQQLCVVAPTAAVFRALPLWLDQRGRRASIRAGPVGDEKNMTNPPPAFPLQCDREDLSLTALMRDVVRCVLFGAS